MNIEPQIRILQGQFPYSEPVVEPYKRKRLIWLGVFGAAWSVIAAGYWLVG